MITVRWKLCLCAVVALTSISLAAKPKPKDELKTPLVAIIPLTGNGVDEATSASVTEALSDELMKTGQLRVMERSQMERILKEQGFQKSGACDGSECAVEVGKLLSINRMVVGTLGKLGSAWTFSVRGVDVQTGEIVGSARRQQKGEIEDVVPFVMPGLADELVAAMLGQTVVPRKLTVPTAAPVVPAPVVAPVIVTPKVSAISSGMVSIPAGCFQMGSTDGDGDEKPVHQVCLDAFAMDATEVTQDAYLKVMGNNPSSFSACGGDCPVENVDWSDASEDCDRVGKKLPTEAQWEYAARAGTTTKWFWDNNEGSAGQYAWYIKNSRSQTHPVGKRRSNPWGLYDMTGNVWEWTNDWLGAYPDGSQQNPKGFTYGVRRVVRGGGWDFLPTELRSANRGSNAPDFHYDGLGFRCVSP
jgi:formylglycine-generating enzyme required for sulfatase activity